MEETLKHELAIAFQLTSQLNQNISKLAEQERQFYADPEEFEIENIHELENKISTAYKKTESKLTHILEKLEFIESNKKF